MSIESRLRDRFGEFKTIPRAKNGREYRVCCPFCSDRKFKMYVNAGRGVYNCYKCGHSGGVSSLLGGDELEADPFAPSTRVSAVQVEKHISAPGQMVQLDQLHEEHPAIRYLTAVRKRPFDPAELSATFGVQYCVQGRSYFLGDQGRFDTTNTIVFPVWMFGKVVGWQARLLYDPDKLTDDECSALGFQADDDGNYCRPPKYMTSPGMSKGNSLYNFDVARAAGAVDNLGRRYVVVTEGPFDAAAVGAFAVAAFGKGISDVQTRLLGTYWDAVYLLLDPGDADAEAAQLHAQLARSVAVTTINLKNYKDAGDAPREEIWQQIVEAMLAPPAAALSMN